MKTMGTTRHRNRRMNSRFRSGCRPFFALFIFLILGTPFVRSEVLTNAAQVLSLPAEQAAQRIPARVTGVVTVAEETWDGRFFIQDESCGVFIEFISKSHPEPGDLVEVTGDTHPGAYAPIISARGWNKVGTRPLPEPRKVPIEKIMSGVEDSQRVEVIGVVRSVVPGKARLDVEISSGGYRLHVFCSSLTGVEPQNLIGAAVRVRGTAAASFNATLRQLLSVAIFAPCPGDFIVEEKEMLNPFEKPVLPLTAIAQYRRDLVPGERVHVKGIVTLQRPGEDIFLAGEKGGLHVRSRQSQVFAIGEVVEAVGFPEVENFHPVLQDAVFRATKESRVPIQPKPVPLQEIRKGLHHAELITLPAKLIDRSFRAGGLRNDGKQWTRTVLMLQQEDLVFTAEAETSGSETALNQIPIGSTIEVTGICSTETGEDKKLKSLQMLMPNAKSFQVLRKPSWWTPQRLLIASAALVIVSVLGASWTVRVTRRNAILHGLICEKEKAQTELQQAHDLLEERVKERTAQLKFQITARKESELQFKAVLSERTRLAQELHDTLEQTLTGIGLQLDTTSKLFQGRPEVANHHLGLARELVTQSQVDVRRSIWDLRSRALEQFDLPGAMVTSSKQLADGANIQIEVTAHGRMRPLPETVEENLLRIAQEAMTNIIKHSHATNATVELDYGAKNVVLRIKDDGRGFRQDQCPGPGNGHFGLLGISERVKRLGAELSIQSEPENGTLITVHVALEPETKTEVDALVPSEIVQ
jgi:signal transduction histidine kinase